MWWLVLYSLLACSFIMSLVWLWATKNKNAGVVDIFWSYNFPVIAFILLWMAPGYEMRKVLFCSMVIIAGLRLGTFLAYRIFSHIDVEEGRYQELRKNYAPNVNRRFFLFFQFQAVSNVILALPFFIITINPNPDLSWLEYTVRERLCGHSLIVMFEAKKIPLTLGDFFLRRMPAAME